MSMTVWFYDENSMRRCLRRQVDSAKTAIAQDSRQLRKNPFGLVTGVVTKSAFWLALVAGGLAPCQPAHALTMAECNAKYNAAQSAGTLNGRTWHVFRQTECGPGSKPAVEQPKPIDALKDELKQKGYSEENIQRAFMILHVGPAAAQCVDAGYEDPSLLDAIKSYVAKTGLTMTNDQVARYYQIDQAPAFEIMAYKGLSDDRRYDFCMAKRRDFAALGLL
ncbi:hypothetical protein EN817_20780 [Mesorhizobium sp. M3A.F.Ca.ET.174.01.1.1]|nr:hypothetical protein EN818_17560 [Mesorhizobium sp. M3A.F.Ca.ET.175.01.1.1]TGT23912.1 hypothetical protein EN817_20780 [Mesorhizobium sp. M3A.F.Ca.ET.174.01.1.1]